MKLKKDAGLEDDCDIKKTLLAHLGAFMVSNKKRIMNRFIWETNGFYNINVYYTDTEWLYIKKHIEMF